MSAAVARKRSSRTTETTHHRVSSTRARSRSARAQPRAQSRTGRRVASTTVGRPSLQVFDQVAIRDRARRRYAIVATFVVLLAGFFAVALIQAQLVANQHRLDRLRTEIAESETEQTRLERLVEEASAPSAIIDQAMSMGMVRATNPIYLAPSEAAVAVPVPISLGSTPDAISDTRLVAAPEPGTDPTTVSAGVEAALEAVASSETAVTDESETTDSEAGVASIAGTTVSADGSTSPSASVEVERHSSVADVVVESALPEIGTPDPVADEPPSGPAWAGAVAQAGANG